MNKSLKIGVLGVGMVGSTYAYRCLIEPGFCRELILVDIDEKRRQSELLDLGQASVNFSELEKISCGSINSMTNCDLILFSAGSSYLDPKTKRLGLYQKNLKILEQTIPILHQNNPQAKLLMATNPVDLLTYSAKKIIDQKNFEILGSGTLLDSYRLRFYLGRLLNINPSRIYGLVAGEHGDTQVVLWSCLKIDNIPFESFIKANNISETEKLKAQVEEATRNAAYKIIEGKSATYYGIANALFEISKSWFSSEESIIPVSSVFEDFYGIKDVCLGYPLIINELRQKNVILELTEKEIELLKKSAQTLKNNI